MTEKETVVFSRRFLLLLLVVSIGTNIVLLTRLNYPDAWLRVTQRWHRVPAVTDADNVRGPARAPITIIEYADFQCPFCAAVQAPLEAVMRDGNVRWVYRHFPISALHPQATAAAEAAECAAEQGKFWEFASALFARQNELSAQTFNEIASDLKLNAHLHSQCMARGVYRPVIQRQMRDGQRLRISGTPTLFINGKRFDGFASEQDLRRAIHSVLN